MKKEYKKYAFIALCLFAVIICSKYFAGFITLIKMLLGAATPLIVGCVIAYAVNILMSFYEKHYVKSTKSRLLLKLKRPLCMLLAFLSLVLLLTFVIVLVVPELVDCLTLLFKEVPAAVVKLYTQISENETIADYLSMLGANLTANTADIEQKLTQMVDVILSGFGNLFGSVVSIVTSVMSLAITLLVGFIFSIYLLSGKEKLYGQMKLLIKTYIPKTYTGISYVTHTINDSFHHFIVGQCTEAVILGTLCAIGMLIFRFPYAGMIGVLIGFTALIPVAGAYIGGAVGALMMLTESPLKAILFLIFLGCLQQFEGNLIYPRVVGKSIGLPGIWVLTAVTLGGSLMGIGGMLIAVPMTAAVYKMLRENIHKKNGIAS